MISAKHTIKTAEILERLFKKTSILIFNILYLKQCS